MSVPVGSKTPQDSPEEMCVLPAVVLTQQKSATPAMKVRTKATGSGSIRAHVRIDGQFRYFFSQSMGKREQTEWVHESVPENSTITRYWANKLIRE
jgi:hypothetical protein